MLDRDDEEVRRAGLAQSGAASLVFEKRPNEYVRTTPHGEAFDRFVEEKKLESVYVRPSISPSTRR